MSQPEARISRSIINRLRQQGWFAFKIHGGPHMMAGLPDIVACVAGRFVALETKQPRARGRVSPRQKLVHGLIERAGGVVAVVTSVDEALLIVDGIVSEAPESVRKRRSKGE